VVVGYLALVFAQTNTTPQQVHLSFTNISATTGDNAVGVSWVTTISTPSYVQFGTTSGSYTAEAYGITKTYTNGGWVGVIHEVVLTTLAANTRYYYRVGSPTSGWSKQFSFLTKPPASSGTTVLVIGDIATSTNTQSVLNSITANYTLSLVAGDLAYADGDRTTWDKYFTLLEPQAANTIWNTAIGNHEAASTDYNGVPYLTRSILPGNELWYSFDYGYIHILVFSTEHATGTTSEQYRFMEADLKAALANRASVPYILTVGHKPPYTSNNAHSSDLTIRANIEPLLVRYGVDISIWGHNHCYERSYPMQNSAPNNTRTGSISQPYNTDQAPIYVTVGCGGKELYTSWQTKPAWSLYREAAYGHVIFTVDANKILHWQYIKTNNVVADEFYIIKK